MNQHPELADLALYSGRDLPLLKRWSVGRHLAHCPACRAEVAAFRSLAAAPIAENFVPNIAWEPLAEEMRANIRLGLEASEAISAYRRPTPSEERWLNWRACSAIQPRGLLRRCAPLKLHLPLRFGMIDLKNCYWRATPLIASRCISLRGAVGLRLPANCAR